MLMIPVPAVAALILGYFALRLLVTGGRLLLVVFLAACAVQSFGVALAQGYGITALQTVLPITAACLPPLAWISFRASLFAAVTWRAALPHVAAPLFCLFCRVFAPQTLDVVLALSFLIYGAAILASLRCAEDLPLARLAAGGVPALIWRALGWMLMASACSDGVDCAGVCHRQVAVGRVGDQPVCLGVNPVSGMVGQFAGCGGRGRARFACRA